MKAKTRNKNRGNFLYPDLMSQLNPDHPLLQLAKQIPWQRFEDELSGYYSEMGRQAKAHPAHGRVNDPQAVGKLER